MITARTDVHTIADRFVAVLESGDETELARLYHLRLRFAILTLGVEYDRATALRNARTMQKHLGNVEVQVVDRQLTERASCPSRCCGPPSPTAPDQRADVHDLPAAQRTDCPVRRILRRRRRRPADHAATGDVSADPVDES